MKIVSIFLLFALSFAVTGVSQASKNHVFRDAFDMKLVLERNKLMKDTPVDQAFALPKKNIKVKKILKSLAKNLTDAEKNNAKILANQLMSFEAMIMNVIKKSGMEKEAALDKILGFINDTSQENPFAGKRSNQIHKILKEMLSD